MPVVKSKVKFTGANAVGGGGTPPTAGQNVRDDAISEKERDNNKEKDKDNMSLLRRKSRKSRMIALEAAPSEEEMEKVEEKPQEPKGLTFPDLDKDVSDGSVSDTDLPSLKSFLTDTKNVCRQSSSRRTDTLIEDTGCNLGKVRITSSAKISCLRSDNQEFASTDYTTATTPLFIPPVIHPLNGQVSSSTRHREYIEYLKSSGFLKLFGACILKVYRMWVWPPPERLLEDMLFSMGYQHPARVKYAELMEQKKSLQSHLRKLQKEKNELLKALDEFEDTPATYELLDQDEVLPPVPENSALNYELLNDIFSNLKFESDIRDSESTDIKVSANIRRVPDSTTLPIPFHDIRMLT